MESSQQQNTTLAQQAATNNYQQLRNNSSQSPYRNPEGTIRLEQHLSQAKQSLNNYQSNSNPPQSSSFQIQDQRRGSSGAEKDLEREDTGGYTEFFSWGSDEQGQLGHGVDQKNQKRSTNVPKSLSFEVKIRSISCGNSHSSFISQEGHVFAFGSNLEGQLGVDDPSLKVSTAPLLVSSLLQQGYFPEKVSCGGSHTAVISRQGKVFTWGLNGQGQCGRTIQTYEKCLFSPQPLIFESNLGHGVPMSVECGDLHTCLMTSTGSLFSFGDNSQGQLGLGAGSSGTGGGVNTSQQLGRSSVAVDQPSLVHGLHSDLAQVSCGFRHTLVLTRAGRLFGFGSNRRHEMGLGENSTNSSELAFQSPIPLTHLNIHNVIRIAAGGFSAAITDKNQLLVWGTGQFGVFSTPQKVCMDGIYFVDVQVSAQEAAFAVAVDQKGTLYSWGNNFDGQLGHGDFQQRILPTQVMQLRRKNIRQVALGDRFAVALGKDVSLASLRKKKEAKARKQQNKALLQEETRNGGSLFGQDSQQQNGQRRTATNHERSSIERQQDPRDRSADHLRLKSGGKNYQIADSNSKMRNSHSPLNVNQNNNLNNPSDRQDEIQQKNHNDSNLRHRSQDSAKYHGQSQSQSQPHPQPSHALTAGYASKRESPLRANHKISAHGAGVEATNTPTEMTQANRTFASTWLKENRDPLTEARSPLHQPSADNRRQDVTNNINTLTGGQNEAREGSAHLRRNLSNMSEKEIMVMHKANEMERLLQLQLDEKERVIRQQQDSIQALRQELRNESRDQAGRHDELAERLRITERERNDLRTRLATELRNYQTAREELQQKVKAVEHQRDSDRQAFDQKLGRVDEDYRAQGLMQEDQMKLELERRTQEIEQKFAIQRSQYEEQARGERSALERDLSDQLAAKERLEETLANEREQVRKYEGELRDVHQDKRLVAEAVVERGKELRDTQMERDQVVTQLRDAEQMIHRLEEKIEAVQAMSQRETQELQREIELKKLQLDEAEKREQDLQRQIQNNNDLLRHRDCRVDELMSEVNLLRKQIDDLNMTISEQERTKSELNQRLDENRYDLQLTDEKLRSVQITLEGVEQQLKTTRETLDRERQRADQLKMELDTQSTLSSSLRLDLQDEQRRLGQRERDISNLENALQHLKESMGADYAQKSRDFDEMKQAYQEAISAHDNLKRILEARSDELDSAHAMNAELTAHSQTMLDKINYQESVIADIEDKNKKLSELLNAHLNERAQTYKENVLAKLSEKRGQPPNSMTAQKMAPPQQIHNEKSPQLAATLRSITPDASFKRQSANPMNSAGDTTKRLQHILMREQAEQDQLNLHYAQLQQQLGGGSQQDQRRSMPLRSLDNQNVTNRNQPQQPSNAFSFQNIDTVLQQQPPAQQHHDHNPPVNHQVRNLSKNNRDNDLSAGRSNSQTPDLGNYSLTQTEQTHLHQQTSQIHQNNQNSSSATRPASYSPLRSRTPTRGSAHVETDAEAAISSTKVNSRQMKEELSKLRSQIANMNREKQDIAHRLSQYEASKMM